MAVAVPPLIRPDGSLTHCPKEKAVLFADVFNGKQSNNSLTRPQPCFPEAELIISTFLLWRSLNYLLNFIPVVVQDLMVFFLCSLLTHPWPGNNFSSWQKIFLNCHCEKEANLLPF